jgi:hypothetical protein
VYEAISYSLLVCEALSYTIKALSSKVSTRAGIVYEALSYSLLVCEALSYTIKALSSKVSTRAGSGEVLEVTDVEALVHVD